MKFFVKVDEELVEATEEQIKDLSVDLYAEDGTVVRAGTAEVEEDLEDDGDDKDTIDALVKTVEKLGKRITTMEETRNEADKKRDAEMAGYKKALERGFPLAVGDNAEIEIGEDYDGVRKIVAPYDLDKQGKRLMDKIHHPGYQIEEKARLELAKFFCLVVRASRRRPDIFALQMIDKLYGDLEQRVYKTAVGDSGNQFPIPDIVEAEILHFAREASVTLQYGRIWEMTSETQSFPQEGDAVSVGWGNTTAEHDPNISELELTAKELSAYSVVKNMTLADSRSDIVSWLTETMAEAAGLELDNKAFNGLGSDSTFVCSGILSAHCGYSVVMDSGSTAFSNLSSTNLSKMISKLDGLKKMGARFWLHGENLHNVRNLKDDNNRPIFTETVGQAVPGVIWGYPYTEVTNMPSTSAANTAFLAFGNLRYFAVGRRLDSAALSVDPYGLWTTNRTRFKIYQRWALAMGLPKGFVRLLTHA